MGYFYVLEEIVSPKNNKKSVKNEQKNVTPQAYPPDDNPQITIHR